MTLALVFLVLALVCFILSAASIASRVNLTAAGLAFLTLSMLVGTQGF